MIFLNIATECKLFQYTKLIVKHIRIRKPQNETKTKLSVPGILNCARHVTTTTNSVLIFNYLNILYCFLIININNFTFCNVTVLKFKF